MFSLVILWSLCAFSSELCHACKQGCLYVVCGVRSSNRNTNDEAGTLNDIIFDPEEEQANSLSQSLLATTTTATTNNDNEPEWMTTRATPHPTQSNTTNND